MGKGARRERQMGEAEGIEGKGECKGCALELKERLDGNVSGLIDLSIN